MENIISKMDTLTYLNVLRELRSYLISSFLPNPLYYGNLNILGLTQRINHDNSKSYIVYVKFDVDGDTSNRQERNLFMYEYDFMIFLRVIKIKKIINNDK